MKLKMTLPWLSKRWKNIKYAYIRKSGRVRKIIATQRFLNRLYEKGIIDEWQEIIQKKEIINL